MTAVTFYNCRKLTPNLSAYHMKVFRMYTASTECWGITCQVAEMAPFPLDIVDFKALRILWNVGVSPQMVISLEVHYELSK